jgi:choloylglycine hydrolase
VSGLTYELQHPTVFPCWVIAIGAKVLGASCNMALLLRLLVALPLALLVSACTYVEVPFGPDDNNGMVVARAMEMGGHFLDDAWSVTAYPRGWTYAACPLLIVPHTSPLFTATHGFVGIVAVLSPELHKLTGVPELFFDGMNENGLMVSGNVFSGSKYGEPRACGTSSDGTTVIDFTAFIPWALSQYATVAELVAALPRVRVTESGSAVLRKASTDFKAHWAVRDKSGASVVIEAMDGTGMMSVSDNTVGVMTNDPPFDWHVTNTAQYAPISNGFVRTINPPKEDAEPFVPQPRGHGFNLIGLPGGLTPANRFVRTFVAKHLAVTNTNTRPKTEIEAINLGAKLLNAVDIADGVMAKTGLLDIGDWTCWAVIKSPSTGLIMWRSYTNSRWLSINMRDLAAHFLTSSAPRRLKLVVPGLGNNDVTGELLQSGIFRS